MRESNISFVGTLLSELYTDPVATLPGLVLAMGGYYVTLLQDAAGTLQEARSATNNALTQAEVNLLQYTEGNKMQEEFFGYSLSYRIYRSSLFSSIEFCRILLGTMTRQK